MNEIERALDLVFSNIESSAEYTIVSLTEEEMHQVAAVRRSLKSGEVVVVRGGGVTELIELAVQNQHCPNGRGPATCQFLDETPERVTYECVACWSAHLTGEDGEEAEDEL